MAYSEREFTFAKNCFHKMSYFKAEMHQTYSAAPFPQIDII